jgi:hypothetical protein
MSVEHSITTGPIFLGSQFESQRDFLTFWLTVGMTQIVPSSSITYELVSQLVKHLVSSLVQKVCFVYTLFLSVLCVCNFCLILEREISGHPKSEKGNNVIYSCRNKDGPWWSTLSKTIFDHVLEFSYDTHWVCRRPTWTARTDRDSFCLLTCASTVYSRFEDGLT